MTREDDIVIGSRVHLRSCPHGEPAVVRSLGRGRVEVEWPDLGIMTSHKVERLQLAPFLKRVVSDEEIDVRSAAQHQAVSGEAVAGILERGSGEVRQCGF